MITLNTALVDYLTDLTGLDVYWLHRPYDADNAIVFRCLSSRMVSGNLRASGVNSDLYSITVYHSDSDVGEKSANDIKQGLHYLTGDFAGYPLQLCEFTSGLDQTLKGEKGRTQYQFNRDFVFNH